MAKAEASVEELVGMIERGELRLPEMQRRYVWRSTRVRDLLDSLYRGYQTSCVALRIRRSNVGTPLHGCVGSRLPRGHIRRRTALTRTIAQGFKVSDLQQGRKGKWNQLTTGAIQ